MAQETKLKRKDLKEPDQFQVFSAEFLDFLNRKKGLLIGILAGIVLAGGGFLFWSQQQNAEQLRMESLYFQMTQVVDEGKGKSVDQLIPQLKSLYDQFKGGDQRLRAGLLLADVQFRNQRYDDALATFKTVRDQSLPESLNFYLAQSGMAHSFESKKDYPRAIALYKELIGKPGEFPLFYTYLGLSRCYELTNDIKNAQLLLKEMQTKFPEHAGLEKVNQSLKRLESRA